MKIKTFIYTFFVIMISITSSYSQFTSAAAVAYNDISTKVSIGERRLYFMQQTNQRQADLWIEHFDRLASKWKGTLTGNQVEAMDLLRESITSSIVADAKKYPQSDARFDTLNYAVSYARVEFSKSRQTELLDVLGDVNTLSNKPLGLSDSYIDLPISDVIKIDTPLNTANYVSSNIYKPTCNCSRGSLCGGTTYCAPGGYCNPTEDGCGCLWLWSCDGFSAVVEEEN